MNGFGALMELSAATDGLVAVDGEALRHGGSLAALLFSLRCGFRHSAASSAAYAKRSHGTPQRAPKLVP